VYLPLSVAARLAMAPEELGAPVHPSQAVRMPAAGLMPAKGRDPQNPDRTP
jgi:hypothetical protein